MPLKGCNGRAGSIRGFVLLGAVCVGKEGAFSGPAFSPGGFTDCALLYCPEQKSKTAAAQINVFRSERRRCTEIPTHPVRLQLVGYQHLRSW